MNSYIQVYNLHRSPYFWDRPHEFEPERFLVQNKNEEIEGWSGFDPSRSPGALYPNEVAFCSFFFFPLCWLIPEHWQQMSTWSDYIGFCLLAFWWRTTKMCRRPICFDGIHCSVDYAAPEFWRGTEGDPWIGGTSYWGNHPYQKRTLVQIEEEI